MVQLVFAQSKITRVEEVANGNIISDWFATK